MNILAKTVSAVLALVASQSALASTLFFPIARYEWNNQIDRGGNFGLAIVETKEKCYTMSAIVVSMTQCAEEIEGGLFGDVVVSDHGAGYSLGLVRGATVAGLHFRYSRFETFKQEHNWPSSDRYVVGLNLFFLHLEAGVKKNYGEDRILPSFGIGLGL